MAPRLTWSVADAVSDSVQESVEVSCVGREAPIGGRRRGVETVALPGAERVGIPWPFAHLRSGESVTVAVRVRCAGRWSEWAETVVTIGLLADDDWSVPWIAADGIGGLDDPAPVFSGIAALAARPARALLTVTAHGVLTAHLNGSRVGDELLAPGWTAYQHRVTARTHDVTALLREGSNRLDILVGNGWYRGQLVWPGNRSSYGDRLAVRAQLDVQSDDGTWLRFGTGEDWRCAESRVRSDDLYDGEVLDLRIPLLPNAATPLHPVRTIDVAGTVEPAEAPPIRATGLVSPIGEVRGPGGERIVDFGQNLVGRLRLELPAGDRGARIRLRHAEVLEGGALGVRPLRSARATDVIVRSGDAGQVEPEFTFHGFRYAEITGADDVPTGGIHAVVMGSDLTRSGHLALDEPRLDRLHENVVWSMRGNFLSIPTDCPQRDERLGWTGDAQVFAPTATFLADAAPFFRSWLRDLALEQGRDGSVPSIVPDVLRSPESETAAGWGDAAVVIPWVLWERYGDREALERQYPSMRAWVERVRSLAGEGVWTGGFQYGDWLDPTAPPEDAAAVKADPGVVATAYYIRSAHLLARAAAVLGLTHDAAEYAALSQAIRRSFALRYVDAAGRILSDCPTVYALAIAFELLDEDAARAAAARLIELVRASGHAIETGFLGTPVLLDALTMSGALDDAYAMLTQDEKPSWLYAVRMGATTVWERWDALLPDGRINPGSMTSFNHYAYGAVADWMHRTIGGLTATSPGYRTFRVAPRPGGGVHAASLRHDSPYGAIVVDWSRSEEDDDFTLLVEVPHGTTATVELPDGWSGVVSHGRHEFHVTVTAPPELVAIGR